MCARSVGCRRVALDKRLLLKHSSRLETLKQVYTDHSPEQRGRSRGSRASGRQRPAPGARIIPSPSPPP